MTKIEELTDEQIHKMASVAAEYEQIALSGNDSYDVAEIRKGIDCCYAMADLKSPEIVICSSPADLLEQAKVKKGETFDWYFGLSYDAGWTAFYDFFQQIGIEYDQAWNFDTWRDFIKKSGVFAAVLCENVAFVCIRPCEVHRNEAGDLHNDKGPAILWGDGYCDFALNGVWVDEEIVMTPAEKLKTEIVFKEKNAEVRRELVRKIGINRVVEKAECVDKQGDYELLLLDLGDGRKRPYLKMKNPSIDAWHVEGVEPKIRTVKEALAWRNGVDLPPAVLT